MPSHAGRRRVAVERAAISTAHDHDHDYSALLLGVRASFEAVKTGPLFQTDASGLNDLYLDSLSGERQVYNCHACRHFIERFGGVVAIGDDGKLTPAMWSVPEPPDFYQDAFEALRAKVTRARVVSVFYSKLETWGTPVTGSWSHMAATPARSLVYREGALTAGQAMAASKEKFRTVMTALAEFKPAALDQALRLFEADALSRAERFVGPVRWLRQLQDRPKGRAGENIVWRAIATAPEGFCHPKASVVGPLLDDIVAGLPFDEIKTKFAAMLHPLRYQRPQAAPAAGAIKAAEALVEKLGIAKSLERRFALLDEIETIWRPPTILGAPLPGGVFAHIKAKDAVPVAPISLPTVTATWDKFSRTVLIAAERLEFLVPNSGNFEAYLTASHPDAPLIFKWANPFSDYVYLSGSTAYNWGLQTGSWVPVLAISQRPNMWGDPKPHLGEGLLLILKDAADRQTGQGNALFPETLQDELHGARSVIEAYAKSAVIERPEGQYASGYGIGKGKIDVTLRAFSAGAWSSYRIDRWD